jgi:hypothetical protein
MKRKRNSPLSAQETSAIEDMLKDPKHSMVKIAAAVGVHSKTVAKIKRERAEQISGPFYCERLKDIPVEVLVSVCRDPSYDPRPATTKVADDKSVPEIRPSLLEKHRLQGYTPEAKKSIQQKFREGGKDFHGFYICPRHESYDADVVNGFLERMENNPTNFAQFTPIFEYSQDPEGPATRRQKTEKRTKDEWRMGDKGRLHVVWDEWCAELQERRKKSEAEVSRLVQELRKAETALDAFSDVGSTSYQKTTRTTEDFARKHAAQATRTQQVCATLRAALDKAEEALAAAEEDDRQSVILEKIMFENYERIMKHSPYLTRLIAVDKHVTNRELLSIILALPDANSQTIHADSLQVGSSLLLSAERRQYLIVLLNAFRLMRSLGRMLPLRAAALEYIRGRIAAEAPGDMRYWDDAAQLRVWNYLCCLQFVHEKIGALQAVRVPIEEGETLVVDNATLHGGSRGEKKRGFRFHIYGYDRNLLKRQGADRYEKDKDVTFDLLDVRYGFYPVCHWAQTRSEPPVFRA